MNKTREQIEKELDSDIPRSAVSQRDGGRGKSLSYLEAWYVIDRLNKVFGTSRWDSDTIEMVQVGGVYVVDNKPVGFPAYRAKVRITARFPIYDEKGGIVGFETTTKEGTGWGADKSGLNPHEMACKEAESDALKRAAMKFGISMGLGLYDKTGEFIQEEELHKSEPPNPPEPKAPIVDRTKLNAQITANGKVCIAKGLYTKESFQAFRKEKYGVDSTELLNEMQANELLATLKKEAQDGKRLQ